MQFNGIGSGHDADMHHVTQCMHENAHYKKEQSPKMGGASMQSQAMEMMEREQEGQLSLSAWLDRMLGNGKRFLRGFWNGGGTAGEGGIANTAQVMATVGEESTAAQSGISPTGQDSPVHSSRAAAVSAAVPPPKSVENNPYFSAIEDTGRKEESLWQKVRVKFHDVTGQLTGHLPGRFLNARNQDAFREKQEKPKADLRKRSRFHGDKLEIDCILTDDSYLLDSYDRKGEYSRLSAEK